MSKQVSSTYFHSGAMICVGDLVSMGGVVYAVSDIMCHKEPDARGHGGHFCIDMALCTIVSGKLVYNPNGQDRTENIEDLWDMHRAGVFVLFSRATLG